MGELAILPNAEKGVSQYRQSTDAASLCKNIVLARAVTIQGRRYVPVEGWQAIAVAHGCAASARDVTRIDGGFRAVGEIRRMSDGVMIAEAEGFVGEDEPVWFGGEVHAYGKVKKHPKRPDYAIRAMAQTRAISRACRSAFAHVVVLIDEGLSTIPAEEVPAEGLSDDVETISKMEHAISQPMAGAPVKDADGHPDWPAGPCKNITALKAAGRNLYREITGAPDADSLDALLVAEKDLLRQIKMGWKDGWNGDDGDFIGFGEYISRRQTELAAIAAAEDQGPVAGDGLVYPNGNTILDA